MWSIFEFATFSPQTVTGLDANLDGKMYTVFNINLWSVMPKILVCFNCDDKLTLTRIRDTSNNILHVPKPDT